MTHRRLSPLYKGYGFFMGMGEWDVHRRHLLDSGMDFSEHFAKLYNLDVSSLTFHILSVE